MEHQADPFRTLGIAPGASLNEIRSAYRRLAKQYHPDAAGERALPRFLAIQAAYEQLVDGEGRLRPPGWGTSKRSTGSAAGPSGEAWRADPNRARASRDAWRARRSTGSTPGAKTGTGSSSRSGTRTTSGGSGSRPPGEREHHARRGPRKATPGSTSYDEAAETPLDPQWEGGAWYGPSSGTYWTINPREYADPRKHGPEYLARARRAAGDPEPPKRPSRRRGAKAPEPEATSETPGEGEWAWTGAAESTTTGGQAEWGARSWHYESRDPDPAGPAWTPGREGRERRSGYRATGTTAGAGTYAGARPSPSPTPPATGPGLTFDIDDLLRKALPENLLAAARRDVRWRLVVALIAWLPIGYGLSASVSAATGCARYAATCPEPVPILLILVQPLIVAALFAVPAVAAVAAFATMAGTVLWMPFGVVLGLLSWPDTPDPVPLSALFLVAYAIAVVAGAVRLRRSLVTAP